MLAMCLRQSALLDQTAALKPEMFSVEVFGRAYGQMIRRHKEGLEVSLSGLTDFSPEEMSHIAGIIHSQQGPVNEQALADCVQIILRENQTAKVETEEDLMALRERMKQRKGIRG